MVREIKVVAGDSAESDKPAKGLSGNAADLRLAAKARRPTVSRKKRVAVFIDGSNLYFKLRTLIPDKMDFIHYRYRDLVQNLLEPNERLAYLGYYVGIVRDTKRTTNHEKTLELIKNQQKLFEQLRHARIDIVKGYLLEHGGRYFEKGVDVKLAVDIVTMAQAKKYDKAIIMSSDTDLIPAIQAAKSLKRQVLYVGFEHQPSLALIRYADHSRLIGRQEAEKFTAPPLTITRYDD